MEKGGKYLNSFHYGFYQYTNFLAALDDYLVWEKLNTDDMITSTEMIELISLDIRLNWFSYIAGETIMASLAKWSI